MLSATLFGDCLEIEVTGSEAERKIGVARLKRAIPDARYDEFKRVWVIQHPLRHIKHRLVLNAIIAAHHQPTLLDPAPEGEIL